MLKIYHLLIILLHFIILIALEFIYLYHCISWRRNYKIVFYCASFPNSAFSDIRWIA